MLKPASLILFLLMAACAHTDPGPASEAGRLEAAVQREASQGFSGTVLVARGDRTLLLRGYGRVGGVAMRPDTRFWISSMGKQFVSAAILLLRDEGALALDDPISRWIPDAPPDKGAITLRQLLSHTSGLPQGYRGEEAATNAEAVRSIMAAPLASANQGRFVYSNDNYQLAAAVVERISGLAYREFVRLRFFAPLRLSNSGVASGPAGVAPTRDDTPERLLQPQWGIEGHFASAPDLLAWYRALRAGRVLQPESVRDLWSPAVRIGEGQAALGWFVSVTPRGTRRVWTRGNDDFGPNSLLYTYPDQDLAIIILSHAGQKTADISFSRALLAGIEEALGL